MLLANVTYRYVQAPLPANRAGSPPLLRLCLTVLPCLWAQIAVLLTVNLSRCISLHSRVHFLVCCAVLCHAIVCLQDFKIGLVGDLLNGRTVHSLAYLLSMYSGVKIYFVAPQVGSSSVAGSGWGEGEG